MIYVEATTHMPKLVQAKPTNRSSFGMCSLSCLVNLSDPSLLSKSRIQTLSLSTTSKKQTNQISQSPNQIHQSQSTPPLLVGTYSAAAGYDSWTFPASVPVASLPRRPPEPAWPPRRAWAPPSPPPLGCQSHCGPGRSAAKGHIQIECE